MKLWSAKEDLPPKLDRLYAEAGRWSAIWGYTRLMREVEIEFTQINRSTLGRCDLRRGKITLNGVLLLQANEPLLFETLCHELAHVVTTIRYGTRVQEHGPEWCEFMEKAGFNPRPVIPMELITFL